MELKIAKIALRIEHIIYISILVNLVYELLYRIARNSRLLLDLTIFAVITTLLCHWQMVRTIFDFYIWKDQNCPFDRREPIVEYIPWKLTPVNQKCQ